LPAVGICNVIHHRTTATLARRSPFSRFDPSVHPQRIVVGGSDNVAAELQCFDGLGAIPVPYGYCCSVLGKPNAASATDATTSTRYHRDFSDQRHIVFILLVCRQTTLF
jgi:hypothetical protein